MTIGIIRTIGFIQPRLKTSLFTKEQLYFTNCILLNTDLFPYLIFSEAKPFTNLLAKSIVAFVASASA